MLDNPIHTPTQQSCIYVEVKKRRNLADTIAFIKNPKAPMPALYPSLINEQNVTDVATYVLQELAR